MFDDENEEIDPKKLPIYKKGMGIFEVVHHICELISDDDEMLGHVKGIMLEDAMLFNRQSGRGTDDSKPLPRNVWF